ncbi:MAG: histidinol dehydrogenase [Eubacteriales bacterium]|nr:histidinol dehydrogenase [Eubacteriales bacterium]
MSIKMLRFSSRNDEKDFCFNLFEAGNINELKKFLHERRYLRFDEAGKISAEIVRNVRREGDEALYRYTQKFDGADIRGRVRVEEAEIAEAQASVSAEMALALSEAADNIRKFHMLQTGRSWIDAEKEGIMLGQLIRPVETAGIYVPSGTAPLPSSVLMSVIPAKVAGVSKIIMCTPPGKDGRVDPIILAAAREAGADEIYRIGGAQAIAAMAFGTASVPAVDVIAGPGNIYVAMAKKEVYGYCGIDMIAGPSEIAVLADRTADPCFAAADLLSQAEHDKMSSSVLVTDSEKFAFDVLAELNAQIGKLGRKETAAASILDNGLVVLAEDMAEGIETVNMIAPEHLEIMTEDPFGALPRIKNAGAVFLGSYSCEPLGDYMAGPSHVLPTGGTARFFSPLGVDTFIKKTSLIYYNKEAAGKASGSIMKFAAAEGLGAHAASAAYRRVPAEDVSRC